jgi:hypothetical protein
VNAEEARQDSEHAADALGPEAGLVPGLDLAGFLGSLLTNWRGAS